MQEELSERPVFANHCSRCWKVVGSFICDWTPV